MTEEVKKATKDRLAEALRKCGLKEMAEMAEKGRYDEFSSDLDLPLTTLVSELYNASMGNNAKDLILKLRQDVIDGKYDATKEESDAWAKSPEGQEAFQGLIKGGSFR
jgi:hypothetical protein